jgi:predicted signal transduction protein with EAL and GGDEF domain
VYPSDGEDAESLIKNSDTAMYYAKKKGRQNYEFFRPGMVIEPAERQSIEAARAGRQASRGFSVGTKIFSFKRKERPHEAD